MVWGRREPEPVPGPEAPQTSKGRKKLNLLKKKSPETVREQSSINNFGLYKATFCSNIGSFLFGIALGWSGSVQSSVIEQSFYDFQLSDTDWNLICLLLILGAALWCVPAGFLVRYIGCRRTILLQLLPNTVGWFLTIFAKSVSMVYAGRFFLGMCGGAHCVAVPIYSAEISTIKKRGAMGVLFHGSCLFGVIYSFTMNLFLDVWIANLLNLGLVTLALLQILMPESPAYYVDRGNIPQAEASLRYLRGKHYDTRRELDNLMLEPTPSEQDVRQGPMRGFKYKKVRRSLSRALVLAVLQKLRGAMIFVFYTPSVLECLKMQRCIGILLCVAVFIGFAICFLLVDRVGRRPLLIISSAINFFVSVFLGLYFQIWLPMETVVLPWIALLCIGLFVGSYASGVGTLTWLLNVELLVRNMRPVGCAIIAASNWTTAFVVILWFSSHTMSCQPYIFLLFAIIALIILLYTLVYIPETMNLSSSKIQQRLGGIMNSPNIVTITSSSDSSLA
ncbi:glucose transporter type 3 [Drosophila eugracilis]|uniref:glucose transporter type 3 n=1 Tax=Drosophila eugracilis TaxID=29029 RepID=UPI001BDB6054|nr:glucose transporter type 3 [Drosophila eugracilis]